MKKNLRIVSAAAAALLAVAPIAATAMPVNAAASQNVVLGGTNAPATQSDVDVTSNIQAITSPDQTVIDNTNGNVTYHMWDGKVNGTIEAKIGGQSYTANLNTSAVNNSKVTVYEKVGKNGNNFNDFKVVNPGKTGKYRLEPGKTYYLRVDNISFNFGTANANRNNLTVSSSNGVKFVYVSGVTSKSVKVGDSVNINGMKPLASLADGNGYSGDSATQTLEGTNAKVVSVGSNYAIVEYKSKTNHTHRAILDKQQLINKNASQYAGSITSINPTATLATDQNGAMIGTMDVLMPIVPVDVTNSQSVVFVEKATNAIVTSGTLNMTANGTHQLNVNALLGALKTKYEAHQAENKSNNSGATITTTAKDLTDELTKAGIKVDALGNFDAPSTLNVTLTGKSAANNATATLPVTVSVANGVQTPAAQETTKTITIMHISTIYDKNGKATNDPALRAYDTYSVVSEPVTINGAKFYKLAGKDQYIKVGNVDGTSRTLRHNSYVYKSSGKRANKKTLKKGSSVTTYGKSFMIAGHQMYRIGKNQYVKKANF